jgi:protein-L-isoaspartate O-methyltransferase
VVVVGLLAFPLNLTTGLLVLDPARVNSPKSLFASIQDPQQRELPVYGTWDSYARIDVTEPVSTNDYKWVYQDGVPVGALHRGATGGASADALKQDIGYLPYLLPGSHDRVLVVGAGTGPEVLGAVVAGAQEVVATEASAGLLRATGRFAGYTGDPLGNPAVRVINQDGRSFLRSGGEQFDVIYISLAAGGVAQPAGVTSGSYLYTREAFEDYVQHLRQDGRLVIQLRDEQELTRAFDTAFQTFTRRGASPVDAIRRLLAVNDGPLAQQSGANVALPLLIVRKTPYLEDEARATFDALRQTPYPPLFVPYLETLSPLGAFAADGLGPGAIESQAPFRVSPATDASPFFFESDKGPPWFFLAAPTLLLLLTGGVALLTRRPALEAIDPDADVPDPAAAFLEDDTPWRFVVFVAVGAGGLALVLLPLLHRLPLLVGDPTLGLPLGLSALALSAALGSLLTLAVGPAQLRQATGWATLAAALLAVAALELVPMAEEALRGQGQTARLLAAVAIALPFGVCAGVFYPAVARTLAAAGRGGWVALLWGVGVLAAAGGAFLAFALGVSLSFTWAVLLGAACLIAAFLMAGLRWLVVGTGRGALDGGRSGAPPSEASSDMTPFQRPA